MDSMDESLNVVIKSKDDEIEALKKQLAALEKTYNDTKAALDQDESQLKKDRVLLLKDKEQLAAPQAPIISSKSEHIMYSNGEYMWLGSQSQSATVLILHSQVSKSRRSSGSCR